MITSNLTSSVLDDTFTITETYESEQAPVDTLDARALSSWLGFKLTPWLSRSHV